MHTADLYSLPTQSDCQEPRFSVAWMLPKDRRSSIRTSIAFRFTTLARAEGRQQHHRHATG
jgi:hypothetical protein